LLTIVRDRLCAGFALYVGRLLLRANPFQILIGEMCGSEMQEIKEKGQGALALGRRACYESRMKFSRTFSIVLLPITRGPSAPMIARQGQQNGKMKFASFEKADAREAARKGGIVFTSAAPAFGCGRRSRRIFPDITCSIAASAVRKIADSVFYADRIVISYAPKQSCFTRRQRSSWWEGA